MRAGGRGVGLPEVLGLGRGDAPMTHAGAGMLWSEHDLAPEDSPHRPHPRAKAGEAPAPACAVTLERAPRARWLERDWAPRPLSGPPPSGLPRAAGAARRHLTLAGNGRPPGQLATAELPCLPPSGLGLTLPLGSSPSEKRKLCVCWRAGGTLLWNTAVVGTGVEPEACNALTG